MGPGQGIICNLNIYVENAGKSFQFYVLRERESYSLKVGRSPNKPNFQAFLAYKMGLEARMENEVFEVRIAEDGGFRWADYLHLYLKNGYLILCRSSTGNYIIQDPENKLKNSK